MKYALLVLVLALGACRVEADGDGDADVDSGWDADDGDGGELAIYHCFHETEADEPSIETQIIGAVTIDVTQQEHDPDLSDGYQHRIGYAVTCHCPGDEVIVMVVQDGETIYEERTVVSSSCTIGLPWVTLATHNGSAAISVETGRTYDYIEYDVIGFED